MKHVYDDTTKQLMRLIYNVRCESALEEKPGSCPDRKYGRCKLTDKLDGCMVETMVNGMIAAGVEIPVRCGKCDHWTPKDDGRPEYGLCYCFAGKRGIWKRSNGYCDKGTPRKE